MKPRCSHLLCVIVGMAISLISCCRVASGQCPDGQCGWQPYPRSYGTTIPYEVAESRAKAPKVAAGETSQLLPDASAPSKRSRAVVRVTLPTLDNPAEDWGGVGSLVTHAGRDWIVSAAHVIRDGDASRIVASNDQGRIGCRVAAIDRVRDILVLAPIGDASTILDAEPLTIGSTSGLKTSDLYTVRSRRADGRLHAHRGRPLAVEKAGPTSSEAPWLRISGQCQRGDSGSPILLPERHVLIAVVWGCQSDGIYGSRVEWIARMIEGVPAVEPVSVTPPPPPPITPHPIEDEGPSPELLAMQARLDALEKQLLEERRRAEEPRWTPAPPTTSYQLPATPPRPMPTWDNPPVDLAPPIPPPPEEERPKKKPPIVDAPELHAAPPVDDPTSWMDGWMFTLGTTGGPAVGAAVAAALWIKRKTVADIREAARTGDSLAIAKLCKGDVTGFMRDLTDADFSGDLARTHK